MNEYEKQANDFLKATDTAFSVEFVEHGLHFPSDKEPRDIYKITLSRNGRKYSFKFGQSIANSGEWIVKEKPEKLTKVFADKIAATEYAGKMGNRFNVRANPNRKTPTAYWLALQNTTPARLKISVRTLGMMKIAGQLTKLIRL